MKITVTAAIGRVRPRGPESEWLYELFVQGESLPRFIPTSLLHKGEVPKKEDLHPVNSRVYFTFDAPKEARELSTRVVVNLSLEQVVTYLPEMTMQAARLTGVYHE